jgi:hypothetical protein
MKQSFYLYATILSSLFAVFTFAYFNKQLKFEKAQHKISFQKFKDSLNSNADANYFSLEKNQNAQNYFENATISYAKINSIVTEKLLDYNTNPNGNPYTGQEKLGENKFIINKVKLLNHRWIIADFSDGNYWGEVLIKYFINEDKSVSFETMQTLVYSKN